MKNEIQIPRTLDSNAEEILRVWLVDGKLKTSLNTSRWLDSANFGIVLADIALTSAEANSKRWGLSAEDGQRRILGKIREALT